MLSSLGLGVQMPHCNPSGYANDNVYFFPHNQPSSESQSATGFKSAKHRMCRNMSQRTLLHVRRIPSGQIRLGKCLSGNDERLLHEVQFVT